MIYDAFPFLDELELLELRLKELDGVVDRHILVESTITFQGTPKPLYYADNANRFERWADRIDHVIVTAMPAGPNHWHREAYQRECITHALFGASGDDVLLLCDVDELPRPEIIRQFAPQPGISRLDMTQFNYWLNCRAPLPCSCARMCHLRDRPPGGMQGLRTHPGDHVLTDAGWHFSYLGGEERIRRKLASFSHSEWNNEAILKNIPYALNEGFALHNPDARYQFVPIDGTFPRTIQEERARWAEWIRE